MLRRFFFFVFFCQALKHLDRLIKSAPQAAAPSGSHTKKYSEFLTHNWRKGEGALKFTNLIFFWLNAKRHLVPKCYKDIKKGK